MQAHHQTATERVRLGDLKGGMLAQQGLELPQTLDYVRPLHLVGLKVAEEPRKVSTELSFTHIGELLREEVAR
jgi:hypothetical protein